MTPLYWYQHQLGRKAASQPCLTSRHNPNSRSMKTFLTRSCRPKSSQKKASCGFGTFHRHQQRWSMCSSLRKLWRRDWLTARQETSASAPLERTSSSSASTSSSDRSPLTALSADSCSLGLEMNSDSS